MIARDNAILLLDHVKYIIVDKISDEESKITEDCVKNIVENLKDRVQNINEDSLIQEFKALRYFMDFSSSSIDVQDMGKYFDEINNTVLFKDLGKTVATYFIEEVSDIEIDLGDLSGDALREEIDDLNNRIIEILYAHGTSDELEFIKENPDGSYSLNTAPVLDFVEEFNDGNEDLFDKLSEVKDIINSPTGV